MSKAFNIFARGKQGGLGEIGLTKWREKMIISKAYKGYKAYDYLEKGKDYDAIKVTKGDQRVPEYLIPLDEVQEKRVLKLAEEKIFIALHDHPELLPDDIPKDMPTYRKAGRRVIAYESMSRSYYDAIIDSVGGTMAKTTSAKGWKWDEVINDLGMRLCDIAHQDFFIRCEKVDDIYKAHKEGKIAWIIGMENAAAIENEIDRLDILYGLGLRQLGLTYSDSNYLGSGGEDIVDGGLTSIGRKAVERMNKIGILIDCAHASAKTTLDTIEFSKKPIILSHIGAKTLWDTKRFASDEVLKACAAKGGVIGVEAAPHTTITYSNEKHTVYSVIEHFEYIKDLVGIDHVSFGTDTLYGDHVALHSASHGLITTEDDDGIEKVSYVMGMENPTEASKNILRYLVKAGYSDKDIGKVIGGNILRVLSEVWM